MAAARRTPDPRRSRCNRCAHQGAAALKFRQQTLVVDIEAERPCGGMSVDTVDEQRELRSVPCHCFTSCRSADANGLFAKLLYGRRLRQDFRRRYKSAPTELKRPPTV